MGGRLGGITWVGEIVKECGGFRRRWLVTNHAQSFKHGDGDGETRYDEERACAEEEASTASDALRGACGGSVRAAVHVHVGGCT